LLIDVSKYGVVGDTEEIMLSSAFFGKYELIGFGKEVARFKGW
jgi:hypothetical protein